MNKCCAVSKKRARELWTLNVFHLFKNQMEATLKGTWADSWITTDIPKGIQVSILAEIETQVRWITSRHWQKNRKWTGCAISINYFRNWSNAQHSKDGIALIYTIWNACHTFHTYHALYGFEAITFSCYHNHYVFTLSIITLPFSELFCSYCEPVSRR